MLRGLGAVLCLSLVLALTGCSNRSAREQAALDAVVAALPQDRYETGRTRCTGNPAPWFVEKDATLFVCVAHRREGGCDWYDAKLGNVGWSVTLERRNAGCVLPF